MTIEDTGNIKNRILVRMLYEEERTMALDLAWRVFLEYESPDYSEEGTEEFRKCLHDEEYLSGIEYYGVPFYHALGFENTDKEQTVNGIRFTPMRYGKSI